MEFFSRKKFSNDLKAEIQMLYSVKTTITKSYDKSPLKNDICTTEFEGADEEKVNKAKNALENLFNYIETKPVADQFGSSRYSFV